ncbi:MAG: hypothetical protein V3V67_14025 [Myxococcota bacterium]
MQYLQPPTAMRCTSAILTAGLLVGCGLGYTDKEVDRRPDRALGVGARTIYPGETSPALRMPGSSRTGSSQTSSGPGSQSGSSTTSGNPNVPDDEDLTMIAGQSGSAQEAETIKEGPAFLPLLGYPFWFLGKSLEKKADRAVEREAEKETERTRLEMPRVETPDDAERSRLMRENAELRSQLRRQPPGTAEPEAARRSIADELAALVHSLAPPAPRRAGSAPPLPDRGLVPPEATDRNGDGRADLWTYHESDGRTREALDEDGDGRVDRILAYDAEHRLERSEEDLDGDGVLETVTLFRDGHPVRRRTDSNGDGQTDAWSFYRGGELERHEVDRDGDGFRDLVMSYESGELTREEKDRNGDGRPDSVTVYRDGQIVATREDLDYDGVTDVESVYENGKLVRRDLNTAEALRTWRAEGGP